MGRRLSDGRSSRQKYIKAAKSHQFSGKEQESCLIPKKSSVVWKHLLWRWELIHLEWHQPFIPAGRHMADTAYFFRVELFLQMYVATYRRGLSF